MNKKELMSKLFDAAITNEKIHCVWHHRKGMSEFYYEIYTPIIRNGRELPGTLFRFELNDKRTDPKIRTGLITPSYAMQLVDQYWDNRLKGDRAP